MLFCAGNTATYPPQVHRNLKPTTVLMTDDCNIKLCGFSQARSVLGGKPTLDLYVTLSPVFCAKFCIGIFPLNLLIILPQRCLLPNLVFP